MMQVRICIKGNIKIISKRISHKGETEKLKDEALAKVYPKKTNNYMEELRGQVNTLLKKLNQLRMTRQSNVKGLSSTRNRLRTT